MKINLIRTAQAAAAVAIVAIVVKTAKAVAAKVKAKKLASAGDAEQDIVPGSQGEPSDACETSSCDCACEAAGR